MAGVTLDGSEDLYRYLRMTPKTEKIIMDTNRSRSKNALPNFAKVSFQITARRSRFGAREICSEHRSLCRQSATRRIPGEWLGIRLGLKNERHRRHWQIRVPHGLIDEGLPIQDEVADG